MKTQPVREPDCVHSQDYSDTAPMQPMSACNVCKDNPELAAWREYWAARTGFDEEQQRAYVTDNRGQRVWLR